jgi:hypothetical protein
MRILMAGFMVMCLTQNFALCGEESTVKKVTKDDKNLAAARAAGPVTLETLLRETADREELARWPVPAYRAMQASALKPSGRKSPGFHAGKAINHFVRIETKPDGANGC